MRYRALLQLIFQYSFIYSNFINAQGQDEVSSKLFQLRNIIDKNQKYTLLQYISISSFIFSSSVNFKFPNKIYLDLG